MNDDAKAGARRTRRVALFLTMMIVGCGVGFFVRQQREDGKGPDEAPAKAETTTASVPKLTPEQVLQAIALKDESIGHLENGPSEVRINGASVRGIDVAAEGFEKLAAQLPDERLPVQNLAVTRLLLLQNTQGNVSQARDLARAAANQFLDMEPNSAVAHWLAAKVTLCPDPANPTAITEGARAKAIAQLQKATELEPDNPVFWFALREAATDRTVQQPHPLAKDALQHAYALRPRNMYLITELLRMQVATEDTAIVKTLTAAKEVFRPLVPAVRQRADIDLNERIDTAIKAAKEGQWRGVNLSVRILQNVVRPEEIAKSDIARVKVHPLEFVVYDFSEEFYAQYARPTPKWNKATPVKLQVTVDDVLAGVNGVLDIRVMDFTLNGLPDMLVLQPGKLRLLGRTEPRSAWTELAALDLPAGMTGLLAADLDRDRHKSLSAPSENGEEGDSNARFDRVVSATDVCHDADPDIIVYGADGVLVVRNETDAEGNDARLVVVENDSLKKLTKVTTGVLLDLDHDGDLDVAFSSAQGLTTWQAGAKMAFTNTSEFSQMPPADTPLSTMVAVDWDRDADIDIVVGAPNGKLAGYMENMRHGEFRWTAFDAKYSELNQPEQLALLEADGNVSWDLLSAGAKGVQLYLTATPRSGIVNYLRAVQVTNESATGALVWDFDNDGFRDAAVWGDHGLSVWRGGPKATYAKAAVVTGDLAGTVNTVACIDLDRDGDQDLVVATDTGLSVLSNEGGTENAWITLYPLGRSDNKGRCNHHAVGSLVELRVGGWYQAQVVNAGPIHFGLGAQKKAEQLRIVWTNGIPQDIVDQAGNVAVCEPMALKGSCPYVYTMANGQFSFFTDCLWAAPIGMQTPAGTVAPTRSWEYLLIPGERLTPRDGSYWVMLTEELWEAGYFDKVQLIAIDHPADVEVYSNEKVGPGEIAELKVHTVRRRRYPVKAVDQKGRDLLPKLSRRDGDFVKAFDRRIRQGFTPEHYIELDLGKLDDPKQITLMLTGWILPTDTSLNVAFAQDPETDGPRMPYVLVPDANGQWHETIAYMGFPGGKTKTIAIDLSKAFLTTDYRVRIATTAEIYWDEAFFTVDEPAVAVRQTPLTLESADLAFRGCSVEIPRPDEAPQMYDYNQVRRTPAWPPMRGKFTRYGAVDELVSDADDMMVVLGAGDAMTVRFAVPQQPLPVGWKRDFFLHSVGWDKDADLNTIYGQTVEPLPFRAMKSYPFDPDATAPGGPAYQDYLRRYQTRAQDPRAFWRQLLLGPKPMTEPQIYR